MTFLKLLFNFLQHIEIPYLFGTLKEYKFAKVSLDSLKKRYETMYFEGKELSFETYQFDQQNTIKEYDKCFVVENRNGETSIEETIIDI